MNFDWQTEDEEQWEDRAAESQSERRPRRWPAVLGVLLLVGLAGWVMYGQVNRRVEQGTAAVEADVAAAYQLVHSAAVHSDRELFESLLAANGYPAWAEGQLALFDRGLIAGFEPIGLQAQTTAPEVISVTLSADMTQAELVADWRYRLVNGETAVFRRTAAMELQGGRWRLASSDEAWGGQRTHWGRYVNIVYPQRDSELVLWLAADLDHEVAEVCRAVEEDSQCDRMRPVRISLKTDESDLLRLVSHDFAMSSSLSTLVRLPTPALVGRPLSEAGYQAMLRAYATIIVTPMVMGSLDCRCEDRPLYQMALLNKQLADLGLNEPAPDFHHYRPEAAPVALPAEDIQALCHNNYRGVSDLYRYDLTAASWTKELSMAGYYTTLSPLPAGAGVMVRQQPVFPGETQARTILWRDGQEAVLFPRLYFGAADPTGQRLLMYDHEGDWSLIEDSMFRYRLHLFDRAECETAGACSGQEISGFLVWSPDGEHTTIRREEMVLWLGDDSGGPIRSMGLGVNPFWLDEETYGFVNVSRTAVMTATAEVRWRGRLVTLPDLLAAVPTQEPGHGLAIGDVAVSPADPNLLFVAVYSQQQQILPTTNQKGYIFAFNRATREVRLLIELPGGPRFSPITFSPGGRWLTVSAFDESQVTRQLYLHNLETNETRTIHAYSAYVFPIHHWSAGGDWLVLVNDGLLHLVAPDYDYQAVVLPESPGCDFVAWVEK